MSTVRANNYYDASGGSNAQLYGVASPPNSMGFRNRLINPGMVIDQRNAGASVTPTADGTYTLDRWSATLSQASKYSVQQSSTAPAGFTNSVLITSLSAYSRLAGDYFGFTQKIEGFNLADLGWGAAGAQTVTLSFWVRSSLTGTFGGSVRNGAANRSYPFTYAISAANTWEQKTVTIAGDTSGTWLTNNGVGLQLWFDLGTGSTYTATAGAWAAGNFVNATGATSVVGTNGATFYITGVQLEAGTVASAFERRDYGRELMMCQRYFVRINDPAACGVSAGATAARLTFPLPVTMRSSITLNAPSTYNFYDGSGAYTGTITAYYPGVTNQTPQADFSISASLATGRAVVMYTNSGSQFITASSEL